MSQSIERIERNLSEVTKLIEKEAATSARTAFGRTSEFWRGIFKGRPNFPTLSEFLSFRREGYGYGMADERQGDAAREEAHARRTYEIFRQSADPNRVAALDEAPLGAPYVFKHHGVTRSAAFWTNAVTALRVRDIAEEAGIAGRSLRVLEIGAGWGLAAHLVHQLLNIESYTVIDLPENLCLSATYLSSVLDCELKPVEMSGPTISALSLGTLAYALPGAACKLEVPFDFILNSFSLQEMESNTVDAYFDWIAGALAPDGVFVSFNSHGKAGVQRPSRYPVERFGLHRFTMFRRYPSGMLNTIPYEMVLCRPEAGARIEPIFLDVFGGLMQFGLGEDLEPLTEAAINGRLEAELAGALREVAGYFSTAPAVRRAALTPELERHVPAIYAYLDGLDAFAVGAERQARENFVTAIEAGLRGFARLRAAAHLAILEGQRSLPGFDEDFDAGLAYPELQSMLDESNPEPFRAQFDRIVSTDLASR